MTGIIKVDDLKDAGGNSIISSNVSGTFTYTFNAGSIAQAALAADIINGSKLADNAVDSEHYTDGSIDNAHIADNAIDSEHYADGSIDTAHYAAGSVDTTALGADAVTAAKIADDVVNSEHLAAGGIDTEHLGALQVTGAKLAADVISAQTALGATPADTDEFMVSDAGVLKRIDYSLIKGGGITHASGWRLNTAFTGNASPIASNLEEISNYGGGVLGSSMTESSGIFTFPTTGFWLITYTTSFKYAGNSAYTGHQMAVTTNNSSYNTVVNNYSHITHTSSTTTYSTATSSYIFDVTNVSNDKVKFMVAVASGSVTTEGGTAASGTIMGFIRLGDT